MQKTNVTLVCDKTGVEDEGVRTVSFAHGSRNYVIDLNKEDADAFEGVLLEHAEIARKAGSSGTRKRRSTAGRQESADIRRWARDNGLKVSDRGRISADVVTAYEDAR